MIISKKTKLIKFQFFILIIILCVNFLSYSLSAKYVFANSHVVNNSNATNNSQSEKTPQGTREGTTVDLFNPLTGLQKPTSPEAIFSNIIKFLLSLVGTLSFIAFIIGGTMWLVSGGESDKVKKGKDIFIYASIGLAVVFSSYVVLRFVIQTVTGQ